MADVSGKAGPSGNPDAKAEGGEMTRRDALAIGALAVVGITSYEPPRLERIGSLRAIAGATLPGCPPRCPR